MLEKIWTILVDIAFIVLAILIGFILCFIFIAPLVSFWLGGVWWAFVIFLIVELAILILFIDTELM